MKRLTRICPGGFLLGIFSLTLAACTTDEPFPSLDVAVSGSQLPALDPSEGQYVLWFSYPDDPTADKGSVTAHSSGSYVAIGPFTPDASGKPVALDGGPLGFALPEGYNPQLISDAIVTIESPGPLPDQPSARLLSGPMRGSASEGRADLTVGGADAFDSAFANVEKLNNATFTLATPSSRANDDENQGLWFVSGNTGPGLPLVTLPATRENRGWTYAAWIVDNRNGDLYPLGRFFDPDTVDSDGEGPYGDTTGLDSNGVAIPLPGSDFLIGTVLVLNSGDFGAVVALHPVGIVDDRPFYELFRMETISPAFPTGVPIVIPYTRKDPVISVSFNR